MDIKDLFVALERDSRAWKADDHFRKIHVKPHGNNLKVPALMRGQGMLATKGGLYDEQFRRPTLAQMLEASGAGHSVFLQKGSHDHWRWTEARVYSTRTSFIADASRSRAELFYDLVSSSSVAEADAVIRRGGGVNEQNVVEIFSYTWIRKLLGEFTLVYTDSGGDVFDTHRDFLIHGVSEHWLHAMFSSARMTSTPLGSQATPERRRLLKRPIVSDPPTPSRSGAAAFSQAAVPDTCLCARCLRSLGIREKSQGRPSSGCVTAKSTANPSVRQARLAKCRRIPGMWRRGVDVS